jgi:hypothetical protein
MSDLQFEHVIDQLADTSAFYQANTVISGAEYAEVDAILKKFAEHILLHTTPAGGSTILKYRGRMYFEIVPLLPDMEDGESERQGP